MNNKIQLVTFEKEKEDNIIIQPQSLIAMPLITMPLVYTDYPLFRINNYDEFFVPITDQAVPGVQSYYWISNYGRVFSDYYNEFVTPHNNHNGYIQISLMLKNGGRVFRRAHRLVMLTFRYFPGCEEYQVNHIDGNKQNCHIDNLEWATPLQNTHHAMQNGLRNTKEQKGIGNAPATTITASFAREIGDLLLQGYSYQEVITITGFNNVNIIRAISKGETWSHLFTEEELLKMRVMFKTKFISDEQIHGICKFFQDNKDKYKHKSELIRNAMKSVGLDSSNNGYYQSVSRIYYHTYKYAENISKLYNF